MVCNSTPAEPVIACLFACTSSRPHQHAAPHCLYLPASLPAPQGGHTSALHHMHQQQQLQHQQHERDLAAAIEAKDIAVAAAIKAATAEREAAVKAAAAKGEEAVKAVAAERDAAVKQAAEQQEVLRAKLEDAQVGVAPQH